MTSTLTLGRFDLGKASREVLDFIKSKKFTKAMLIALAICPLIADAYYENENAFWGISIGLLVLIASMLLFWGSVEVKMWLHLPCYEAQHGWKIRSLWIIWTPAIIYLLSTCFYFAPYVKSGFVADEQRWIINEIPRKTPTIAIPFHDSIRSIWVNQSVSFETTATTKDGIRLSGKVTANLSLVDDPHYWTSNQDLQGAAKSELTRRFQSVIGAKNSDDLTNNLVIECKVNNNTSMSSIGVKWNGTIQISNLHVDMRE